MNGRYFFFLFQAATDSSGNLTTIYNIVAMGKCVSSSKLGIKPSKLGRLTRKGYKSYVESHASLFDSWPQQ